MKKIIFRNIIGLLIMAWLFYVLLPPINITAFPFWMYLFLCILTFFIVNIKDKLNRISFYWVIFSFIILCVVGWGTLENGLILYALYFSWAIVILMYNLIKQIFNLINKEKAFLDREIKKTINNEFDYKKK